MIKMSKMMKKLFWVTLMIFSVTFIFSCKEDKNDWGSGGENKPNPKPKPEQSINDSSEVVLAYVTSWSSILPDPNYLTHINYAFGHVNETFNGVTIDNEARLQALVDLKKKKASLYVILSLGGGGGESEASLFRTMAKSESYRKSFAADCKRVIDEFKLDGIDIDWESPANNQEKDYFTLLMQDIRNAIGKNKFLTFASGADPKFFDLEKLVDIVNFVNIMTYDMGAVPYHHSALYRSNKVNWSSASEAVDRYLAGEMPAKKMVLGIPFYGYKANWVALPFWNISALTSQGYVRKWDDVAKVPYMVDASNNVVFVYEDVESIGYKCEYLLLQSMRGAMYWEYSQDDSQGTLRKAVWNGVMKP